MGEAIAGKRDRIFLMTKGCAGEKRRERGLRDLNESLRRLRTDRIDLWLVHSVRSADEVEAAHAADGVLSIVEEVKRAGKVRYVGFSGHADPRVHRLMLERGYPFDAVLMPLSAVDGSREDGFQRAVLPELVKRGIAPLGMKSLLGKAEPVAAGVFSAAEAIRYTMSLPITALVLGMSRLAQLEENLKVIRGFTPMGRVDALALETRCRAHTHFERYRA
jgi:aryl-alcohol dehydrogenase-like predicted oxidoreductase